MADATTAFLQSLFDTRQSSQISGDPALNAFSSTLSDNNLFKMAAAPVLGAKFDNSTWSPATTFGVSAGQAFLGAALQGLGQNWEAEQMNKATAILPQLYENPASVALPEGMASGAFEKMRLAAERQKIIRDAEQQSAIQRLFGELQMKKFEKALDLEMDPQIESAKERAKLKVGEEALGDSPLGKVAALPSGIQGRVLDQQSTKIENDSVRSFIDDQFEKAKKIHSAAAIIPGSTGANEITGIGVTLTTALQKALGREMNAKEQERLQAAVPDWNDTKGQIDLKKQRFLDLMGSISKATPLAETTGAAADSVPGIGSVFNGEKVLKVTRVR